MVQTCHKSSLTRMLRHLALGVALVPMLVFPATTSSEFDASAFSDQRPYLWEAAVDDAVLDEIRGGILLIDGYIIDFAMEATTTINGQTIYSSISQSQFEDLVQVVRQQNSVIQIGDNNTIDPALQEAVDGYFTVIQNSESDVEIAQVIDATIEISNFDLVAEQNLQTEVIRSVIELTSGF